MIADINYIEWLNKPDFPKLDERQDYHAKTFVERLKTGDDFTKPLYRHQQEAILRVIYNGEKLGKWDVLLDIVTGGGKTVIMSAIVSYFWQIHGCERFLILVPNTIVRERVKDDFEAKSPMYAYRDFPFFFNSYVKVPERLVCKVLRESSDAASIRDANIIVANIHQLYESRQSPSLEMLLSEKVLTKLVIFNDEAHNAAAEQYREVLKLLRSKTIARVDLTATPYRLDKQDLDTYPPIYEYHVEEAIRDRVVKQIVVTKPDIASVKLQYEEWDEEGNKIRTLEANEMPWEEIEQQLRKSGAVKFVTAKNARRQQLQIAQSCLDWQRKMVPLGLDQKHRHWEPLMLVVALSQKDALQVYETLQKEPFGYKPEELLLVHNKQDETENRKAFLLGRKSSEGLSKEDVELWEQTRSVRVIIGISMLREGWDVRNIAIICLFRKFSYQKKGDVTYTVYGPQIIGRGLRRIRPSSEKDHLFVIDHPAFGHDWLWRLLAATEYGKALNPGEAVDSGSIEDVPTTEMKSEEESSEPKVENVLDIEAIIKSLPDITSVTPVADWQKHFRDMELEKRVSSALQKITNIKSHAVGSALTAHEIPDAGVNVADLNEMTAQDAEKMSKEELIRVIHQDIQAEPHQALMAAFRQETADALHKMTEALNWVVNEKFEVSIDKLNDVSIEMLQKIHFYLPQIFDEYRKPEVILAILGEATL
mgnify:FL=1